MVINMLEKRHLLSGGVLCLAAGPILMVLHYSRGSVPLGVGCTVLGLGMVLCALAVLWGRGKDEADVGEETGTGGSR